MFFVHLSEHFTDFRFVRLLNESVSWNTWAEVVWEVGRSRHRWSSLTSSSQRAMRSRRVQIRSSFIICPEHVLQGKLRGDREDELIWGQNSGYFPPALHLPAASRCAEWCSECVCGINSSSRLTVKCGPVSAETLHHWSGALTLLFGLPNGWLANSVAPRRRSTSQEHILHRWWKDTLTFVRIVSLGLWAVDINVSQVQSESWQLRWEQRKHCVPLPTDCWAAVSFTPHPHTRRAADLCAPDIYDTKVSMIWAHTPL